MQLETKAEQFTREELEQVRLESEARLAKRKKGQRDWELAKKAADPVAFAADKAAKDAALRAAGPNAYKARRAAAMREWRAKNKTRAQEISRNGNAKYVAANPATRRKSARDYMARKRAELLAFFGNQCVRCGFADARALQVDHIHGDGHAERKGDTNHTTTRWKLTRDNPALARAKYQLLCANCNWIKRSEAYEYGRRAKLFAVLDEERIPEE